MPTRIYCLLSLLWVCFIPATGYAQDALGHFRSRNKLGDYLRHNWDRQNELSDPAAALQILDQTLQNMWRQPQTRAESEELLWVQLSRADYLFQLGKILESIQGYETALVLHRRYRFPDMVEYLYKPLITSYTMLGENEKARVIYESAFREAKPGSLPGLYNNLGLTYWNEGRNDEALQAFKKGLKVKPLSSIDRGLLQLNLARSLFELEKSTEARATLDQAIQVLSPLAPSDDEARDYLAGAYALDGSLLLKKKQALAAEFALKRALQLEAQAGGTTHRDYGKTNIQLGYLFLQKKGLAQAVAYFDAAIAALIPRYQPQTPLELPPSTALFEENTLYEALAGKASALEALYQQTKELAYLSAAFRCHLLAQEVEHLLRNSMQFESSKLNLLAYSRKRMEDGLAIAFSLYQQTQDKRVLQDAWSMVEQNKAAVLLEAVREHRLKQALHQGDTLLLKAEKLKKRVAWLENAAITAQQPTQAKNYQLAANLTRNELADLKTQVAKRYPAYAQLNQQLQALNLSNIRQGLLPHAHALVLEYFVGEKKTYLFCLTQTGAIDGIELAPADTLRSQVRSLLRLIQDKNGANLHAYQSLAYTLFTQLVPATLGPKTWQTLVLIPDAELSRLPFEALVDGASFAKRWSQVKYWGKKVQIQYGYSLGVLLAQRELSSPTQARLLAFAPEFRQGERGLAPLLSSKREIQAIKGIAKTTLYTKQANWGNFAQQASRYSLLHLATHASVDRASQQAGIECYDRRAYLSDIYALSLQADLVCLSACESALGKDQKGEGVMSLARAFAYAGAKGLVATLWSVNENASTTLFASFYQHLQQGHSKVQALHLAKLDYLNNPAIPAFQKSPYYWAALTYIGEDSPIHLRPHNSRYWLIAGLLIITLGWMGWHRIKRTRRNHSAL